MVIKHSLVTLDLEVAISGSAMVDSGQMLIPKQNVSLWCLTGVKTTWIKSTIFLTFDSGIDIQYVN